MSRAVGLRQAITPPERAGFFLVPETASSVRFGAATFKSAPVSAERRQTWQADRTSQSALASSRRTLP